MASLWQQFSRLSVTPVSTVLRQACVQHTHLLRGKLAPGVCSTNTSVPVSPAAVIQVQSYSSKPKDYTPASPYKRPGPRRYGFENKMYGGGLLPRPDTDEPLPIPQYRPKDPWRKDKALFGQNDYIDILGDGSIHPLDILRGPSWLIGFRGNELQRLTRRLRFQGREMQMLYPTKYHQLRKRIKFLYKKANRGRKRHSW